MRTVFHQSDADCHSRTVSNVANLLDRGVTITQCRHTLHSADVTPADLIDGVEVVHRASANSPVCRAPGTRTSRREHG